MNKKDAKIIAETITNEQLEIMFNNAKNGIKDWTVVSNVNKGISKGVAWNVLARNFDVNHKYHLIGKYNMIREFGDYLPEELKPLKKIKEIHSNPVHQDPIFESKKVKGVYNLWDWVINIDGKVVQIIHDDMMELPYEKIVRHATDFEILKQT